MTSRMHTIGNLVNGVSHQSDPVIPANTADNPMMPANTVDNPVQYSKQQVLPMALKW